MLFINTLHHNLHLFFFFFNDTATTEIYTLSLHDALPISLDSPGTAGLFGYGRFSGVWNQTRPSTYPKRDRKSTRLNSSHSQISYAVFCLKKKKKAHNILTLCDYHNPRSSI